MSEYSGVNELISEDWLRSVGFKWHQIDRQPSRHWVLGCRDVSIVGSRGALRALTTSESK
jgi:hypothetical protein